MELVRRGKADLCGIALWRAKQLPHNSFSAVGIWADQVIGWVDRGCWSQVAPIRIHLCSTLGGGLGPPPCRAAEFVV